MIELTLENKIETNIEKKIDDASVELDLESELTKTKNEYKKQKLLYEEKKLLKFRQKLPSNKGLRMEPYDEKVYEQHTSAIRDNRKNY